MRGIPIVYPSCHAKGCDSLSLSKGRYDETFAGEYVFLPLVVGSFYMYITNKSAYNTWLKLIFILKNAG